MVLIFIKHMDTYLHICKICIKHSPTFFTLSVLWFIQKIGKYQILISIVGVPGHKCFSDTAVPQYISEMLSVLLQSDPLRQRTRLLYGHKGK